MLTTLSIIAAFFLLASPLEVFAQQTSPAKKPQPQVTRKDSIVVSAGISKEELGKDEQIRRDFAQAQSLVRERRCDQAMPILASVVEEATKLKDLQHYGWMALEASATCHALVGEWNKAEAAMLDSAARIEKWGGPEESSLGHAYLSLAYLQMAQKKWSSAEDYCRRSLATYDRGIAKFSDFIGTPIKGDKSKAMRILGIILREQGRFDEALIEWQQAYDLGVSAQASPDELGATVGLAIGLLEWQGRESELGSWRTRSDHVQQLKSALVDPEVSGLFEVGNFMESKKQYADAFKYWEQAYTAGVEKLVNPKWLAQLASRAAALAESLGRAAEMKKWRDREQMAIKALTP